MVAAPALQTAPGAVAAAAVPPKKSESKSLSFYYGAFQALKSVSMPLYEKKVTALIGPSGCGKSTCCARSDRCGRDRAPPSPQY